MVLARLIAPEAFGVVAAAQVLLMFFQTIGTSGLIPAIVYEEKVDSLLRDSVFSFSFGVGLVLAVFFLLFAPALHQWFEFESGQFIFYLLSFVLIFHLTGDVKKPNVLIISVDDMNDWVGCMGHQQALTPNIDRLAEEGMLFLDAHVAAPVCNPSRVSFYTGLHPFNSKVYENGDHMRVKNPDVITMPQYFRSHGYKADAGGKTFHDVSSHHDVMSFDSYYWWHPSGEKGSPNHGSPYSVEPDPEPIPRPHAGIAKFTKRNFDWASLDENDRPLTHWPDYKVASWACDYLKKDHDKPFFLNVGLPFTILL